MTVEYRSAPAWPWLAGTGLMAIVAAAAWFVYSGPAARADVRAPSSPADVRQQAILKQNLDRAGDPELGSLYHAINSKYFGGGLPVMPVRWEPALRDVGAMADPPFTLEGMFGRNGKRTIILLNPSVRETPGSLERALCHEMVHAFLFTKGDLATSHGPRFKAELWRLSKAGAFEGISASDEEKAALKAWLDGASARIAAERADVEAAGAELGRARDELDRDVAAHNARVNAAAGAGAAPAASEAEALEERRAAHNRRVDDLNARIERDRDDVDRFNREVARYNLMISYPDGFDEAPAVPKKPLRTPAGGR